LIHAVQQLRFQRHEVVVFHVLDPQELLFEFNGRTRFEGLEGLPAAVAQADRIRADYLEIIRRFLSVARAGCASAGADYALANTAEPADHLLIRYLAARAKHRGAGR
jgi:hypothetical protein